MAHQDAVTKLKICKSQIYTNPICFFLLMRIALNFYYLHLSVMEGFYRQFYEYLITLYD